MYSYGSPHMAAQKQDDQHERTFSSYVRIRDVVLKTYLGRWTIGRSGERGSGISVLPARYDDIYIYIYISKNLWSGLIYVGQTAILSSHFAKWHSNTFHYFTQRLNSPAGNYRKLSKAIYIYIYIYIWANAVYIYIYICVCVCVCANAIYIYIYIYIYIIYIYIFG